MHLEQNLKGLCVKFGVEFDEFLNDLDVENVHELTVYDLEAVCEEYEVDLLSLLFKPMFRPELFKAKLDKIKYKLCEKFVIYKITHKITQRELAEIIGIHESLVSKIVHYHFEEFTVDRLITYLEKISPDFSLEVA